MNRTCKRCNGSCFLPSPFWLAISKENDNRLKSGMPHLGYDEVLARANEAGVSIEEPAISPCPACGGTGMEGE